MGGEIASSDGSECTVLIVDDVPEIRMLVRALLAQIDECRVVAEAANGAEAIELARRHQPTVCVLDVEMPLMSGLEALPDIRACSPGTAVVIYSSHPDRKNEAFRLGAREYLEKGMRAEYLVEVVQGLLREEGACDA